MRDSPALARTSSPRCAGPGLKRVDELLALLLAPEPGEIVPLEPNPETAAPVEASYSSILQPPP